MHNSAHMSGSERRRYPRIGRKYGVKYRVRGGTMPASDDAHIGMVTNLSQGGIVLVSKQQIEVGALLELEFPESIFGGPRTLSGRVIWLQLSEEGEKLVGCQFVRTSEPAKSGEKSEPVVIASGPERRRYERWEQKVILKIRCVTAGPFQESRTRDAMLSDLSKGGLELVTTREYARNLVLEVQMPENALGRAQTCQVRILRSSGAERAGQFALGCAFVRLLN